MAGKDPVGSIGLPSDSGSGDSEVPKFIQCVDGREPHIHEVWAFGEDGVTREFYLTVQVDVGAGVVGEFATYYLTESWHRIPIFGRISINGSVEWLGAPEFHRTDGPAWTANILATRSICKNGGTTTNQN